MGASAQKLAVRTYALAITLGKYLCRDSLDARCVLKITGLFLSLRQVLPSFFENRVDLFPNPKFEL